MLIKPAVTVFLLFWFNSINAKNTSVLDIVVVGKDTLIASTHNFKIIASYNGGKSWEETHVELIKKLGKEGRRIWGIDSWRGIHEPPYSRLFYSDDFGKKWVTIELNPKVFLAEDFIEIDGRLFIVDDKGRIWKHLKVSSETANSWVKIVNFNKESYYDYVTSSFNGSYVVMTTYDTLYSFNYRTSKTFKAGISKEFNRASTFLNKNDILFLKSGGDIDKYNIPTGKRVKLVTISGYKYFVGMTKVKDAIIVVGLGNNKVKDYSMVTKLDSNFQRIDFPITGLDIDIGYMDKFDRTWFCTTDGIFLLQPNNTFSKVY